MQRVLMLNQLLLNKNKELQEAIKANRSVDEIRSLSDSVKAIGKDLKRVRDGK